MISIRIIEEYIISNKWFSQEHAMIAGVFLFLIIIKSCFFVSICIIVCYTIYLDDRVSILDNRNLCIDICNCNLDISFHTHVGLIIFLLPELTN